MNEYLRKALHHAETAEVTRTTTGDFGPAEQKFVEYNLNLALIYALIGHHEESQS